jgi:hypothetical protein
MEIVPFYLNFLFVMIGVGDIVTYSKGEKGFRNLAG